MFGCRSKRSMANVYVNISPLSWFIVAHIFILTTFYNFNISCLSQFYFIIYKKFLEFQKVGQIQGHFVKKIKHPRFFLDTGRAKQPHCTKILLRILEHAGQLLHKFRADWYGRSRVLEHTKLKNFPRRVGGAADPPWEIFQFCVLYNSRSTLPIRPKFVRELPRMLQYAQKIFGAMGLLCAPGIQEKPRVFNFF